MRMIWLDLTSGADNQKSNFNARHWRGRNSRDGGELKKKKEAIGTCGAPRFDGVIAVACLKMRLPRLINHRQSRARERWKDAAINGKWRKLRHRAYPCCVREKRYFLFLSVSLSFSSLFSVSPSVSPPRLRPRIEGEEIPPRMEGWVI